MVIYDKKKITSTVPTEKPVNTKTSTVQINNNSYIEKKNTIHIENLGKKKISTVQIKNTSQTNRERKRRERGPPQP